MRAVDVVVIGAGAAGLMCAITAGQRGRSVLVLDHANKVGKKILMSGGGRCNFTNLYTQPDNFISHNPHFCKSALSRYTQWDFIALVEKHGIAYHEKKLGQLFCNNKSKDIVELLLTECDVAGVTIELNTSVADIDKDSAGFRLKTSQQSIRCTSLVIATGGLSIPTMGATGFGYKVARQFGHSVYPTRAALVPFTLNPNQLNEHQPLVGTAVPVRVACNGASFSENMLFTHRGLSGPAMLQISSYWQPGEAISIDLLPDWQLPQRLAEMRDLKVKSELKNVLAEPLTKKLAAHISEHWVANKPMLQYGNAELAEIAEKLSNWSVKPSDTEGYRTAEVTLGGVNTDEVSSKTMESQLEENLYFIGEVLDVTGHLGGFNFQWAWASGFAAGSYC